MTGERERSRKRPAEPAAVGHSHDVEPTAGHEASIGVLT
jgi:hypothetical protein